LSDDYGDYSDFEGDSTNINQIPQQGQGGQAPQPRAMPPSPQMFPQGSPHLSHMGARRRCRTLSACRPIPA